jgi:FixJ family two-component response regulator
MIQTPPVVAVLDDEPQMCKALRRLLATHGFRAEAYQRGNDSLANGFDVSAAFEYKLPNTQ